MTKPNECQRLIKDIGASASDTILLDPMPEWADECVEEFNRANDEVIIRALSKI